MDSTVHHTHTDERARAQHTTRLSIEQLALGLSRSVLLGAFHSERLGDRVADAAARAGHDADLAV